MKKDKAESLGFDRLRKRAEEMVASNISVWPRVPDDVKKLIHELQVHQVELDMQNDELRKTQGELQASRNKYADLFQFAPMGYFAIGANDIILDANIRGARLLGANIKDVIGRRFSVFVANDHRKSYQKHLAEVLASNGDRGCELVLERQDGSKFPVRIESMAQKGPDGQSQEMLVLIIDITDNKRIESGLKTRGERLALALEETDIGLWDWNIRTNELLFNPRFARTLGYDLSEPDLQTMGFWQRIIRPDDMQELKAAYGAHARGETEFFEVECRVLSKSGKWVWFQLHGKIVDRDKDGNAWGLAGTIVDITKRKAELQLKARQKLLISLLISDSIDECLSLGCQAIYEAQLFERALFTLHNENRQVTNAGWAGISQETISKIRTAKAPDEDQVRTISKVGLKISKSFFISRKAGSALSGTSISLPESESSPEDGLFILSSENKSGVQGWLVLDSPFKNVRPTSENAEYLEEIVDIVSMKIREIKLMHDLESEREMLYNKNIALKEVMASISAEKTEIRKYFAHLIRDVLAPAMEKLIRNNGTVNLSYYHMLKANIKELSDDVGNLLSISSKLSPREIEIANMIASGASSKDIADSLGIALVTVQKHREVIRKKLGVANKNINLMTYLRQKSGEKPSNK